jgi:geranylgeranyl diphosphate synthase type I
LREGKRTVLMAIAMEKANASAKKLFTDLLGNPELTTDQIKDLQDEIVKSGAVDQVEEMIAQFTKESLLALTHSGLSPIGKNLLTAMASIATKRNT